MILFIRHCISEQDHVEKNTLDNIPGSAFAGSRCCGAEPRLWLRAAAAWCAGAGAPLELFLEHCWNFIHKAPPL